MVLTTAPFDLKAKIHCILQNTSPHKWQGCAWILNQEPMQNMAAVQFAFKINSKLHTQVSQDTNESVDKAFRALFYCTEARKMKETNL